MRVFYLEDIIYASYRNIILITYNFLVLFECFFLRKKNVNRDNYPVFTSILL